MTTLAIGVTETRKINGVPLDADITLTPALVKAAPEGYGLGEQQPVTVADANSDPLTWLPNGGQGWVRFISSTTNKPDTGNGTGILFRYMSGTTSGAWLHYLSTTGTDFTRYWNGTTWHDWNTNYTSANLPKSTGTAPITVNQTTGAIGITAATTTAAGSMSAADKIRLDAIGTNSIVHTGGGQTINGALAVTGELSSKGSVVFTRDDPMPEIPLPDVWIPFNNSLIMKEGYGDELQADGITYAHRVSFTRASTATYIDKSGVLRTAAVNEPRFEKEGLLIEGQSTNLHPYSVFSLAPSVGAYMRKHTTIEVSRESDNFVFTANSDSTALQWCETHNGSVDLPPGTYTLSVFVEELPNPDHTYIPRFMSYDGATDAQLAVVSEGWKGSDILGKRVSITATTTATSRIAFRFTGKSGEPVVAGDRFVISKPQIEALPFASSYIPTSGAAATRAADVCSIIPDSNLVFENCTITAEYNFNAWNTVTSTSRNTVFGAQDGPNKQYISSHVVGSSQRGIAWWSTSAGNSLSTTNGVLKGKTALVKTDDGFTVWWNGVSTKKASTEKVTDIAVFRIGSRSGSNDQFAWGHIRNFRIWHKALPDYHLKALTKEL